MSAVGAEAQGRNRPSSGIEAHGWIKPSTSEPCSLKPPIAQNGALGFDGCGLSLVGGSVSEFQYGIMQVGPVPIGKAADYHSGRFLVDRLWAEDASQLVVSRNLHGFEHD